MMTKKSFWKMPLKAVLAAALALSMALIFTSCGNGGDTGPTETNAALASRTLTGNVYTFDYDDFSFDRFIPSAAITVITSRPDIGVTGTINAQGVFNFELPATLPVGLPMELVQDLFFYYDDHRWPIGATNLASGIILNLEVPMPPASLTRSNITETRDVFVTFIYLNNATTIYLSEAYSFDDWDFGTVTIDPFRIGMQQGWNAIYETTILAANTLRLGFSGGEPAGLKWVKWDW